MTTLSTAFNNITTSLSSQLNPLLIDNTIQDVIIGSKTRGTPKLPHIKIMFDTMNLESTTIGSMGNNEAWNIPIRIGSVVKNNNIDEGLMDAIDIISQARTILLNNRQWDLPEIIRKVDSKQIMTVPYPFGQKKNLYGAGTIFNVLIVIDNK